MRFLYHCDLYVTTAIVPRSYIFTQDYNAYMGLNWKAEKDMARDVKENKELYKALADDPDEE